MIPKPYRNKGMPCTLSAIPPDFETRLTGQKIPENDTEKIQIYRRYRHTRRNGRKERHPCHAWARSGGWNGRSSWVRTAGGSITISVKNVFTAASRVSGRVWSLVRITIPNGLKSVKIRGRKTQNNSLYSYFQREPLWFLMCRSACWHIEKMARFQTLSDTQNGSTAFRFIRLAVLPLFSFCKMKIFVNWKNNCYNYKI